jgi:glycerate 2-kinase
MKNYYDKALGIFQKTLQLTSPGSAVEQHVTFNPSDERLVCQHDSVCLKGLDVYVTGSGKASCEMAGAIEAILGSKLKAGLILYPESTQCHLDKIDTLPATHPLPDKLSLTATSKLIRFCDSIPGESVVINLLSGGTSSLLCKPAGTLNLNDLRTTYRLLLKSGADIHEINTVRKALSAVKGGQMLSYLSHTQLIDLIISDVPDDNPADIGSGPTTAQSVSYRDASEFLQRRQIYDKVSKNVQSYLEQAVKSATGARYSTREIDKHRQYIISSARIAAHTASRLWIDENMHTWVDQTPWSGPSHLLAEHIIESALKKPASTPAVLIFYGESYIEVTGSGQGGRNQELVLRVAMLLHRLNRKAIFMSAGTDGLDGPTDAAGAFADHKTIQKAQSAGLDPLQFLKENDSYTFFEQTGGHIKTGPTGNNLMDLQFLILT